MGYHHLSRKERYIVGTMRSTGKSQRDRTGVGTIAFDNLS